MKLIKSFLSVLIIFSFLFIGSCKKETIVTNTDTVHDTVCVQPSKREILVQKTWQVDELYRSYQNTNTHFVRGGTNTTGVNYGNLRLSFTDDGTGTYTDETGTVHTLNWNLDSDSRNATLTIGPPYPNTFTWNLVEIRDNYLHSTSIANVGGDAIMVSVRYIQVP